MLFRGISLVKAPATFVGGAIAQTIGTAAKIGYASVGMGALDAGNEIIGDVKSGDKLDLNSYGSTFMNTATNTATLALMQLLYGVSVKGSQIAPDGFMSKN